MIIYNKKNNEIGFYVKLFNIRILSFYKKVGFGWIRLFGRGLLFKDTTKHQMMFSERNGYMKKIIVGNWLIRRLKDY